MVESEYGHVGENIVKEEKPEVEVVTPDHFKEGFGFGEGAISYEERIQMVSGVTLLAVESALESNDILTEVSRDSEGNYIEDDGCGDGRGVNRIFHGLVQKTKSLARSKVFGGGATMVSAMEIGAGKAQGKSLNEVFSNAIHNLKDKRTDFGAHTDEHAHGENCGCGAIDKAPQVIGNAVKYEERITKVITSLGLNLQGIQEVYDNYRSYALDVMEQPYSGKTVANEIAENGKVIKELKGDHREMYVLLNTVEGYTVNQELIRTISDDEVQVFAIDVWRLQELAARQYPDAESEQNKAFLSELIYTLGVSATLTKGDLPVRILSKKEALATA